MYTETKQTNPAADPMAAKSYGAASMMLDEEDDFLKELRQLSGMDEPAVSESDATVTAGKTAAPVYQQPAKPQPQQPAYVQPEASAAPQARTVSAPEQPEWQPRRSNDSEPELFEDRQALLPGWLKGLFLLGASAAVLFFTVLAVLNGLGA